MQACHGIVGADRTGRSGVTGGQDAPVHRCEMRGEEHLDIGAGVAADRHLDLGRVPVMQQAVGGEVLVDGTEGGVGLRRPTGATHAAGCVDDDAGGLDQARLHEWAEGERGGGDVAAGRSDQFGTGEIAPKELGQAEDEVVEQFGGSVRFAVPGRVQTWVVETEIGGEVDHVLHLAPEIGNHRLAGTMGQTEEDEIGISDDRFVVPGKGHLAVGGGERGVQVGDSVPGLGVAGGRNDREFGMRRADAQQFCAREAGRADDGDLMHGRNSTGRRIFMQRFAYDANGLTARYRRAWSRDTRRCPLGHPHDPDLSRSCHRRAQPPTSG